MAKNVEIFIRREGLLEPVLYETHDGSTVAAIKAALITDDEGEFLLFEENADEPLLDHHLVRHHGDPRRRARCSSRSGPPRAERAAYFAKHGERCSSS